MKHLFTIAISLLAFITTASAQTEQENAPLKATSKRRVSVHDPSVVYNPTSKRYYIFGSHKAGAYTTDKMNWTQANPKPSRK